MGRKGGPGQEGTKRPLRLAGREEGGGETRVQGLGLAETRCWKAGAAKGGPGALPPPVPRSALLDPCESMPRLRRFNKNPHISSRASHLKGSRLPFHSCGALFRETWLEVSPHPFSITDD